MRKRLAVGLTLAVVLVGLMVLDGWMARSMPAAAARPDAPFLLDLRYWLYNGAITTAIVLVLTAATAHELVGLARNRGYRPFARTAQFFAALLVVAPFVNRNWAHFTGAYDESWGLLWLACAIGFCFIVQAALHKTDHAMENLATTIFIVCYTGGLSGFMTKLRMEVGGAEGVAVLLFSMFIVKMTDTGAYFTGRAFGRHRMIEWLSPKKTWEGFIGGMTTAVVLSIVVGLQLHAAGLAPLERARLSPVVAFALLGLLMGIYSVAGDLAASLLKRDAQVKDSGHALPGLGGVLDVMDSPLLAAPVAWFFWTHIVSTPG